MTAVPGVVASPDGGESAGAVADAAATSHAAQTMASIIAKGLSRDAPPTTPTPDAAAAAAATPTPAAAAPAPNAAAVAAAAASAPDVTEVETVLSELGIDLGVKRAELPAELQPMYDRVVTNLAGVVENELAQVMEASESQRRMKDFSDALEKEPDKLLLAIAINKPEVFTQVAAVVQQMQSDPNHRDLVLRELTAAARERDAIRREAMLNERDKRVKARQVIAATASASREMGVDHDLAEKVVALAIQANGGDIDLASVKGIVADLKPSGAAAVRVASPASIAAARTAPTGAVAGAPAAGAASPGLTPATDRAGGGGKFKTLVHSALQKAVQAAQEQ